MVVGLLTLVKTNDTVNKLKPRLFCKVCNFILFIQIFILGTNPKPIFIRIAKLELEFFLISFFYSQELGLGFGVTI